MSDKLKFLFILPSARFGSSGYYIQDLAKYLVIMGHECLILCENESPQFEDGVEWIKYHFEGCFLHSSLREKIAIFQPNVIVNIGVRAQAMRIALELKFTYPAAFFIHQSEDSDKEIFEEKYPKYNSDLLHIAEQSLTNKNLNQFLKNIDWSFTKRIFFNPNKYRYVEPLSRLLTYKLADLHSAIWYPFAQRLEASLNKPTFILPPVIDIEKYKDIAISSAEKNNLLQKYKINNDSFIIFISGTIYNYAPEFKVFLKALSYIKSHKFSVVITGQRRNNLFLDKLFNRNKNVKIISMNKPNDKDYLNMIKACHVIAAPGFNDEFNHLRLPSRLVKAMIYKKAIFTFKTGLGQSLTDDHHAILTKTNDAQEWALEFKKLLDEEFRCYLGNNAYQFALDNFSAQDVAIKFVNRICKFNSKYYS